jgi:peptide/nickel transport system permease protein
MLRYIARRLFEAIPVLILITISVFGLLFLVPGDPVIALLGPGTTRSVESIEKEKVRLGLDKPIPVQYVYWLHRAIKGDLGRSAVTKQVVADALRKRLPVSVQLATFSIAISVVFSLPLGVLAALKPNSVWDLLVGFVGSIGLSIPNFWLGILLIYFLAVRFHLLPASGFVSLSENPIEWLKHMLLPAIALGGNVMAGLLRFLRSSLLEVLGEEYIRTARAKGLREHAVILIHALKPSLIPVITVLGLNFGLLLGGSLIVESIFLVPGVGSLIITGIFQRDFPVVQAGALVIAVAVVFINLSVDVLYAYLDPRIRYD